MSWLSGWRRRWPVYVAGLTAGTQVAVLVDLPKQWTAFWLYAEATGVRLTAADGVTLLDLEVVSWDGGGREAELRVAFTPAHDGGLNLMWLYWDCDTPADVSASVAGLPLEVGGICLAKPPRAEGRRATPGRVVPVDAVGCAPDEWVLVWVPLMEGLVRRLHAEEGSDQLEEIEHLDAELIAAGSAVAEGVDLDWSLVTAGAVGWMVRPTQPGDYVLKTITRTTLGQVLHVVSRVRCRTPQESEDV